jgi:hypothetical protein
MDGLVASAIPVQPSIEAFVDPEFSGPTALTVTKDGRVFGHLALFNTCHIGFPGTCVKPPKGSKYQYFHTGQIETAEGDFVDVGHLTFKTGHAPMQANPKMAAEHYDNTGTVAADVRAGEDKYGIWVVGALRSHLSDEDIRAFRAAPLSGDWRRISGKLELVGALAVNVPGFPVPRARAMVASGQTETLFTFLEDNNEEFAGDDYELKLRLDKKASLSKRIFPQIDTIAADGNIEGTILGETVDGLISDYELQLRYDKKLALIKKMGNYEDVQFAQSLDDFISTKDNEVPTGDSLPNPDSLPDLPNIPTKQDIVKRAKNYTKSQFLHDLQDLRDLLDDPEEKIKASDRKSLEALYAMFVNTDKTGKKVTTAGENLEEFYNKCHGPGGKFCSTGGGGGGGGTGKGVTGRHFVPNIKPGNPGHEHTHEKGAGGGKPGGGGGGNKGGNQGQNKGGGGDRYAQYKADAVKDLSNYRKATISARRWFSTATIATVADLAVHGGFPLAKIVGPLVPGILVTPAGLTALIGIGLFVGGKQVIASRQHKAAFKATIDKINKTQKIDEQIRRLHASKP